MLASDYSWLVAHSRAYSLPLGLCWKIFPYAISVQLYITSKICSDIAHLSSIVRYNKYAIIEPNLRAWEPSSPYHVQREPSERVRGLWTEDSVTPTPLGVFPSRWSVASNRSMWDGHWHV